MKMALSTFVFAPVTIGTSLDEVAPIGVPTTANPRSIAFARVSVSEGEDGS